VWAVRVVAAIAVAAIAEEAHNESKSDPTPAPVGPDVASTPPNGFDPHGLGPAPESPRGTGESTGNHTANVTVTDADGNVVTRTRFDSAPMTEGERAWHSHALPARPIPRHVPFVPSSFQEVVE
jgi:hypothetical protein